MTLAPLPAEIEDSLINMDGPSLTFNLDSANSAMFYGKVSHREKSKRERGGAREEGKRKRRGAREV